MNSLSKKQFIFALLALLCLLDSVALSEYRRPISYKLRVNIEPTSGSISVRAKLKIPVAPGTEIIRFGLHETFLISKLTVNGRRVKFVYAPAALSQMTPAFRDVVVSLTGARPTDEINLETIYAGRLKEIPEFGSFPDQKDAMDDQINTHLVELAMHSSWYPQFPWGTPLNVDLDLFLPQHWTAICSGREIKSGTHSGWAFSRWVSPQDIDILIVAAPNFKKKAAKQSGPDIEIYYTQMPEEFIAANLRQIASALTLYRESLGETVIPASTVKQVYSPKRKGQGLAGIARPGMIVTSEGRTLESLAADPNFSLFQGIAHEIAHFWWNFGKEQGDWINEGFAEYYSAMAVQKIIGEANFRQVLEYYRRQVNGLPASALSLSTVPFRNDSSGFVVRYYKSALMLDRVRTLLGDEQFAKASREFFQTYKDRSIGTPEFRSFWKTRMGDHQTELDVWLDSGGGGLPQEVN